VVEPVVLISATAEAETAELAAVAEAVPTMFRDIPQWVTALVVGSR
jgi:L-asparagine transporter-like permease